MPINTDPVMTLQNNIMFAFDVSISSIYDRAAPAAGDRTAGLPRLFDRLAEGGENPAEDQKLALELLYVLSLRFDKNTFRAVCSELDIRGIEFSDLEESVEKDKFAIISALVRHPRFFAMAWHYCGQVMPAALFGHQRRDAAGEEEAGDEIVRNHLNQVKRNGFAIRFVPEDIQYARADLCAAAVKQTGRALPLVKNKSYEVCLAAVEKYGPAVEYILDLLPGFGGERIFEIFEAALKKRNCGYVIQYLFGGNFKNLLSPGQIASLCEAAVKSSPPAIRHIPESLRTEKICRAAVSRDAGTINYVPPGALWFDDVKKIISKKTESGRPGPEDFSEYFVPGEEAEYYEDDEKELCVLTAYPYPLENASVRIPDKLGEKGYKIKVGEMFLKNKNCERLYIPAACESFDPESCLGNKFVEIFFWARDMKEAGEKISVFEKEIKGPGPVKCALTAEPGGSYSVLLSA